MYTNLLFGFAVGHQNNKNTTRPLKTNRKITHLIVSAFFTFTCPALAQTDGQSIALPIPNDLVALQYGVSSCMDVRGDRTGDGIPVQIYSCNGTPAQAWSTQSFGLKSLRGQSITLDQTNYAETSLVPFSSWDFDQEVITDQSGDCLSSSTPADGTQLRSTSCNTPQASGWSASPITSKLHGNLDNSKIPSDFMANRGKMMISINNGLMYQNGTIFSSTSIQSQKPPSQTGNCVINFSSGSGTFSWSAVYTTYYAILTDGSIFMVNACGKAPILPGTTAPLQLPSSANMINH